MATVKRDYYEVLGIAKNAEGDVIKSAYRKMAIKYHPDKNPDKENAREAFEQLNKSYNRLINSKKKDGFHRVLILKLSTFWYFCFLSTNFSSKNDFVL